MKQLFVAMAAFVALETAALACSCLATDDPAQLQRFAAEAAEDAVALVEAEALTSYQMTPAGEQMKVVRTLAGAAPAQFRVERRGHMPSSASCDVLYTPGKRVFVILYPAESSGEGMPTYRTSGLCTADLLGKPVFRDAVRAFIESGSSGSRGERG